MARPEETQRTAAGLPRWKTVLFSAVPLVAFLVCLEFAAAVGYYQLHGERSFALMEVFDWATNRVTVIKTTTSVATDRTNLRSTRLNSACGTWSTMRAVPGR